MGSKDILSKKQIRVLLDTMKGGNERFKVVFVEYGFLYVTNAYYIIRVKVEGLPVEGVIEFNALEVWYKLASARDYLSTEDLIKLIGPKSTNFPSMKNVFPEGWGGEPSVRTIAIDSLFFSIISRIFDQGILQLSFGDTPLNGIKIRSSKYEHIEAYLLPVRLAE